MLIYVIHNNLCHLHRTMKRSIHVQVCLDTGNELSILDKIIFSNDLQLIKSERAFQLVRFFSSPENLLFP